MKETSVGGIKGRPITKGGTKTANIRTKMYTYEHNVPASTYFSPMYDSLYYISQIHLTK